MLIRIGNALIEPGEITMIADYFDPARDVEPELRVCLRGGQDVWIRTTMDEAEAALIDAGLLDDGAEDPQLNEGERGILTELMAAGYEWIARDGDGRLFAYKKKPIRVGAYWEGEALGHPSPVRIAEGFDFVDGDGDAWGIAWLLAE